MVDDTLVPPETDRLGVAVGTPPRTFLSPGPVTRSMPSSNRCEATASSAPPQ